MFINFLEEGWYCYIIWEGPTEVDEGTPIPKKASMKGEINPRLEKKLPWWEHELSEAIFILVGLSNYFAVIK